MEIIVRGRNAEVSDCSRTHANEKLLKIGQFVSRAQRADVKIVREPNPSQMGVFERIEITVIDRDPVIRTEAVVSDRHGAPGLASGRLLERLRRVRDRRKEHRRPDAHMSASLTLMPKDVSIPKVKEQVAPEATKVSTASSEKVKSQPDGSPVAVRQKLYEAQPMSVDQALYGMELVGHPSYLSIGEGMKQPYAVYYRYGRTCGVIRLDIQTI